jgi:DNA-directed RNA polymerase subunit RPC12/RpoP
MLAQVAAAALLACPDCAYRTARRFNLKKHVEGVHGRCPRYVCAECDAAFRHAGSLRQHQHSAHLGALYACPQCDKVKAVFCIRIAFNADPDPAF